MNGESADICLLLEGTFPYVAGGVSSWVNEIIRGFPDHSFALVFVGSRREEYERHRYELPDNVIHFEEHFLFSDSNKPPIRPVKASAQSQSLIRRLHQAFRTPSHTGVKSVFGEVMTELHSGGGLTEESFLYGAGSWDFIVEQYRSFCTDPSFVDYFWTVRTMHTPIWRLSAIADNPYPAKVYHSISTGYAGLLGALLHERTGRPLILSEHGIYTKERKIDLFQADWVKDNRSVFDRSPTEVGYLKELWVRFFEELGRICYDASDEIIALYEANRQRQIRDGASAEKSFTIPNGIDVQRFAPLRERREAGIPPVLSLIGRVVPIKDIKTFIRAMRSVVNHIPNAEGWIVGPTDEDPDYAEECDALVRSLALEENVKFLGFCQVDEILPKTGVLVLSSISEALPLVVLEGFAAGVPALCTDVGSCRQLIYGEGEEDRALGGAGRIVGIADPKALAAAAIELLEDQEAWQQAQQAAVLRVERYYERSLMFQRYGRVYDDAIKRSEDGRHRV